MAIRWEEIDHEKYEDMVSVLVSRLYPDAQRIDGKGGDGGRDVQIVGGTDQSLVEAFQLKSFTGRMKPGRRQQVACSLKRAATLKPKQWTLIVPIDPTPNEDKWFRKLGNKYCFPVRWCGKTWLDDKMATFPDISRYFLEGAKDEVYNLLRELKKERARITDVQDAIVRVEKLRKRLSEIDPYYRYEISTGPTAADYRPPDVVLSVSFGGLRVDVYPKYLGAAKDRPITIDTDIIIGPDYKVVQEALDYGLELDLPSKMISSITVDAPFGLGGSFTGYELHIFPNNPKLDDPLQLMLTVMEGNRHLAGLPVEITDRTVGLKGAILTGGDSTGWLQTRLKVDMEGKKLQARFWLNPKPTLPAHLKPLFQWIKACRSPNRLVIRWPNGSEMGSEMGIDSPLRESIGQVVEALAFLQEHIGAYWEIQPSSLEEDGKELVMAATLLKGENIDFRWTTLDLTLDYWGPELNDLLEGRPKQFIIERETWLKLDQATIPLGRIRTHFPSARLAEPKVVKRALESGKLPKLQFVPGDDNKASRIVVAKP